MKQKWLDDINDQTRLLQFGEVTFKVTRHRNQTATVDAVTHSKLKYQDNDRAFADLQQLLNNLIENKFSGTVQFTQTFKDGLITTLSVKNTKTTNYREQK